MADVESKAQQLCSLYQQIANSSGDGQDLQRLVEQADKSFTDLRDMADIKPGTLARLYRDCMAAKSKVSQQLTELNQYLTRATSVRKAATEYVNNSKSDFAR